MCDRHGAAMPRSALFLMLLAVVGFLAACASTSVAVTGDAPVDSLCQTGTERLNALVLWGPRWRADQKDAPRREEAAGQGIDQFLSTSGCYTAYEVRRVPLETLLSTEDIQSFVAESKLKVDRVVVVAVRELGPVVKLLASLALVEGGTEVVLDLTIIEPSKPSSRRDFTVRWENGGPGVIRGVGTLPEDMQAALVAGLRPPPGAR